MRLTYFSDVCSMWCVLGDEALARLAEEYGDRVEIVWRLPPIGRGEPLGMSVAAETWYYERCFAATGRRFNPHWLQGPQTSTWIPNAAVEAARLLGVVDGRARVAINRAGCERGEPVTDRKTAVAIVAAAGGLDVAALDAALDDPRVAAALDDASDAFDDLGATVRPTFLIESDIGDHVLMSGIYRSEPIAACIDAMISDEDFYRAYHAGHGSEPPA